MWENLEVEVDICERCKLGKNMEIFELLDKEIKKLKYFFCWTK